MGTISLKLRNSYQVCDIDVKDISLKPNVFYVLETEHGVDIARSCGCPREYDQKDKQTAGSILREATEEDLKQLPEIESIEQKAFGVCKERIETRKLEMKLVSVKCLFDKTKIIFYFVAENRVDFRELVKDLASVFRTRIEMRQIGVRDETRLLSGYGLCGRGLCCCYLKDNFDPVSIKMAKEQNLNLNSLKISGMCGRLLCCLAYEYDVYKDLNEKLPQIESLVTIGDKIYKVIGIETLKKKVRLKGDDRIISVGEEDIQKDGDKYFISVEVLEKLSAPMVKEEEEENYPDLV